MLFMKVLGWILFNKDQYMFHLYSVEWERILRNGDWVK